MRFQVEGGYPLRGRCQVPGDKSVSHRALMLGSLAEGTSAISNLLEGNDCLATVSVMRALGVEIIKSSPGEYSVAGRGLRGLIAPTDSLDCASSGTTMRLLAGLMAGQAFSSTLTGSEQLSARPMNRVIDPLVRMGAKISSRDGRAPLRLTGLRSEHDCLRGVEYAMPMASAQVKSCLLLAGLYAGGPTTIANAGLTRDHTERMLRALGAEIVEQNGSVTISPQRTPLNAIQLTIPGDMSSAAFILVAAAIIPGSDVIVENLGTNPTRLGLINALAKMGANVDILNKRESGGEPLADVRVHGQSQPLAGATFEGDEIVTMIDELPILAVAATMARGTTVIRGAAELRVKETDRIATTTSQLACLGADISPLDDGMVIQGNNGGGELQGARVTSFGDHRLAMSLAVAGLTARGRTVIEDAHVVDDSFPGFFESLEQLGARVSRGEK